MLGMDTSNLPIIAIGHLTWGEGKLNCKRVIVLSMSMLLAPGIGSAFEAANKTQIVEGQAGSFEVLAKDTNSSAASIWCGAGDYVISELEEPDDTPIILIRALGNSSTHAGKLSVDFTIEPTDDQLASTINISVAKDDVVGATMTAFAAKDQCASP